MAWRPIVEADVLTQISGDELAAVRAAALQALQADPLQPTIDQVTAVARGYIAGCTENVLDADTAALPEELIGDAVALIVVKLMGRVAGLSIDKDEVRRDAARTAEDRFTKVAKCLIKIVQPEDASTEEIASPAPRFPTTARVLRYDREGSQDGI